MKTVFEHSTVNELREMVSLAEGWLMNRNAKVCVGRFPPAVYQVMLTFYSEAGQELRKRMEIREIIGE